LARAARGAAVGAGVGWASLGTNGGRKDIDAVAVDVGNPYPELDAE